MAKTGNLISRRGRARRAPPPRRRPDSLDDRITSPRNYKPLPGSLKLIRQTLGLTRQHYRLLGGIMVVYLILNVVLVRGLASAGGANLKASIIDAVKDNKLSGSLEAFGLLLGNSEVTASASASLMQSLLVIFGSLVLITTLRRIFTGDVPGVKEAYYQSTAQLVPFVLVLLVLLIHLLPFLLGTSLLQATAGTGVVTGFGGLVFLALALLLSSWSLYMATASLTALYIVTLPRTVPLVALRSAKKLVNSRRLAILGRLAIFGLALLVGLALLTMPFIVLAPALAEPVFYVLTTTSLALIHVYLYNLYRKLMA